MINVRLVVLFVSLAATTGLTFALGITDPATPLDYPTRFLVWNLILAWMPAFFAVWFATVGRRIWLVPLGLGWLAFLPNAPYLVTDLIHLGEGVELWRHVLQYGFAAWTGILLGVVSMRLVHARIEREVGPVLGWTAVVVSVGLCAIGVVIGRFQRWNSWDLVTRPDAVMARTFEWVRSPFAYVQSTGVAVAVAAFFGLAYLTIWSLGGLALTAAERPGLLVAMRRGGAIAAAIVVLSVVMPLGAPAPAQTTPIDGMSVFLDPGHSGANDASMSSQVPNGRGGTKECQTTGTATNAGYPEHTFNWDVATRVRAALEQMGVRIQMSRADDSSVGPCVDERAAAANRMRPDADVSIHADGGPGSGHGFHVNYSAPPLNDAQSGPAIQLATTMRDSMTAAGLQPSSYIGSDGLYGRADLAGLNLAEYPAVLVETGNMRNADDAAQMETAEGRQRYADAITAGIVAFLTQT